MNLEKYTNSAPREDLKPEKFNEQYKISHDAYAALLKSNKQHKYSLNSNGKNPKKASCEIKHVTDFIFGGYKLWNIDNV